MNDYGCLSNTFKVSNLTRPRSYKTTARLRDLQKPKSVVLKPRLSQPSTNVYDKPDFRGLLHADFYGSISSAYPSKRYDDSAATLTDDKNTQVSGTATGTYTRSSSFYGTSVRPK